MPQRKATAACVQWVMRGALVTFTATVVVYAGYVGRAAKPSSESFFLVLLSAGQIPCAMALTLLPRRVQAAAKAWQIDEGAGVRAAAVATRLRSLGAEASQRRDRQCVLTRGSPRAFDAIGVISGVLAKDAALSLDPTLVLKVGQGVVQRKMVARAAASALRRRLTSAARKYVRCTRACRSLRRRRRPITLEKKLVKSRASRWPSASTPQAYRGDHAASGMSFPSR